jgi:hypothetical protein
MLRGATTMHFLWQFEKSTNNKIRENTTQTLNFIFVRLN